jgi:hypothetical protein
MDAHGDLLNAYEKEAAGRLGGTSLVVGVRWLRAKDAGSVRILSDTGATEDAVVGANSAARRHRPRFAKPSY